LIRRIKEKSPKLIIVIRGSTFSRSTTESLFELFSEIDAVINGEGELPLSQLIDCLRKLPGLSSVSPIKGLTKREAVKDQKAPIGFQQITSLNSLPPGL